MFTKDDLRRLGESDVIEAVGAALASAESNEYDPVVHNRRAQDAVTAAQQVLMGDLDEEPEPDSETPEA